ncbi:MAG: OsmC family peroxiredoxin [Devosia sp.]|nr:OsmC family peroxiredoxin [Devosia sp.]
MTIKVRRSGRVVWKGGPGDGLGAVTTQSGAIRDHPYGFHSRFGVSTPKSRHSASRPKTDRRQPTPLGH